MRNTFSALIQLLWRFCPQIFSKIKTWDKLQWTSPISDLYTIVRIISKNVPGLATHFIVLFGAMDEPLASGHLFSCTGYRLYILIIHLWDTFFSALIQLPMMFLSTDYLFEKINKKQMGQVTMDLLYIRGNGWTTCLQYDRPLLDLVFKCHL